MEVFNRIKSTVSTLSTVLPGNPVTREYEVGSLVASAGPGLLWKVYQATKKSTKQEAAVFVLEKKALERFSRRDKEQLLEIFKKGVAQLTRLRHPSVLTVQHPLEESRESLAFATEPVFASLANILDPGASLSSPSSELQGYRLHDIEVKYGLLQLAEGLAFLHNDVKLIHGNLCPQSILVNKNGAWKLAGFDFSRSIGQNGGGIPDPDSHPFAWPDLDFLAPEGIRGPPSDMFSLGQLECCLHNGGNSLVSAGGSMPSWRQACSQFRNLHSSALSKVPQEAKDHVRQLLSYTPESRPDAFQVTKLKYFDDLGVKTLQYLDSLYQWDNLQKSQFFKGLPQVIIQTPKRICLQRILPCLIQEYVNHEMIPFVLPNVLLIAEEATVEEFGAEILPGLVPIFKLQEPIQILLIFMQKMELLLTKCPPEVIRNHVLPMIYNALESDAQQIQELCLNIIPSFASLIEYPAMKNALLPRIKKLCLNTAFLSVRVNCLVCLGKLLEHLDKWLVLDEVLPFLPQVPSREPAVLMAILGIYKLTMNHKKLGITKDVMASKVIPFLMPLTIENGLTLNQFTSLMAVVKEMVAQVETEHRAKLEQLNSLRKEHQSTLDMVNTRDTPLVQAAPPPSKDNNNKKLDFQEFLSFNSSSHSNSGGSKPAPQHASSQPDWQQLSSQTTLLSPTSCSTTTAPASQCKDLTSTLIASNLATLSVRPNYSPFSPPTNAIHPFQTFSQALPTPFPTLTHQTLPTTQPPLTPFQSMTPQTVTTTQPPPTPFSTMTQQTLPNSHPPQTSFQTMTQPTLTSFPSLPRPSFNSVPPPRPVAPPTNLAHSDLQDLLG